MGSSVRGPSHERSGSPNQDALAWEPPAGTGAAVAASVADGHGSAKCFRSHIGAELAVRAALRESGPLRDALAAGEAGPALRDRAAALPRALCEAWRGAVAAHLADHPFTEGEWDRLRARDGDAAVRVVEGNTWTAYGATLLLVLAAPTGVLYAQLGDGDILTVAADGTVRRPLDRDERHFANETTSLCSAEAWREVRVRFEPAAEGVPGLILLSTDGYSNSFREEAGFLQVASDLWSMLRREGLELVSANLGGWLEETSRLGSGDDISVALLVAEEHLPGADESAPPRGGGA